jgi:Mrp family chromosome partitioning ATPase/uncharacterized protein involved in exopolysaccharide biosynthesis
MEFLHLFKALYKKKWIIALSVLIAITAAYLLTRNQKKQYTSTAQIATGFTTGDEIRLTDDRFNGPGADIKFSNVIENFTSAKVLSLLSYDLTLHDLTEKYPFRALTPEQKQHGVFKKLPPEAAIRVLNTKLAELQPLRQDVPEEEQALNYTKLYNYDVGSLSSKLQVSRVGKTDYINLTFTSDNPELSAYAINRLIQKFENYYFQNKQQRSDTSIAALDSLVRIKKEAMDRKVAARTNYLASRGILDVNMEGSSKMSQIASYQSQLMQERATRESLAFRIREINNQINALKSGGSTSSPLAGSSDNLEYVSLKNQYRQLYKEYVNKGSNDPEMKKRLQDLNDRMQQLDPSKGLSGGTDNNAGSLAGLMQNKLDAEAQLRESDQKIILYQQTINQLNGGLSGMASQGADVDQLNREVDLATSDYNNANNRLTIARNVRDLGLNSFKQTLLAQPAMQPEPTHRPLIIALAGIGAFILSSLVIILLAFLDSSIRTPSQFNKLTNLKLLGVVNHVKLNASILEGVGAKNNDHKLRNDTFRELLRKVRYEIENSGKKIFLFTSTEPQQGKTTLIQALSYSLSLVKKKVLIIDTNFCNNDLTAAISAKPVLERFHVNGRGFMLEDIKPLITKTSVEGVDMIGCEGGNYTPREILPANHLLNYLNELTAVYDFIFLEGAPLNDYTDTKELIHYSDGIVAVFSSEASLSATDKESIRFFKQNEKKFLGAILNKVQVDDLDM